MAVNRLQDILDYRNLANTKPIKIIQLRNKEEMPMVNRAIGSRVGVGDQYEEKQEVGSLHEMLTTSSPKFDGDNLAAIGLGVLAKNAAPALKFAIDNPEIAAVTGGLMGIAAGDDSMPVEQTMPVEQAMPIQRSAMGGGIRNFKGQVPGQGHGMEDNVFMPIVERNRGQQVATLAVSPDEYVVDAHTMSALGNGSADAGAKVMDNVVKNVREKAYGTDQQPNEISGLAALRPMIERV